MSDATPPPPDPTFAPPPALPPPQFGQSAYGPPGYGSPQPGQLGQPAHIPSQPQPEPLAFGQPAYSPPQPQPGPPQPGQPAFGQPTYGPQPGHPPSGPTTFGQPAHIPSHPGQPQSGPPAFGQPAYSPPQPQPGQPPSGPPAFGPSAFGPPPGHPHPGYPQPGRPGHPAYPQPVAAAPKKRSVLRIVLPAIGLAGLLLVGLGVFGVSAIVSAAADPAKEARVGDCLAASGVVAGAGTTETSATVVECSSAQAQYTVVARVEGESSPNSTACDKFFPADQPFYVYGSTAGGGYVLCLRPKG